jgi:phage-related minor tail protein
MSGVTIATLAALLTLDVSDFVRGADKAADKAKGMGDRLTSFAPIAAAGFAVAGAAIVGVGAALYSVGDEFDAAYDKIRTGTGKTGVELEALQDVVKNVATEVPASFDEASTAVTMLSQRLGLSGHALQGLSGDFLELSRITGTDLTTNIQTITRVFGDWSITDTTKAMDEMFRATQLTGVGIGKLAEEVVSFGAPLRGLGFGFEESLAMLGKWEKEGVNVENVMGAMKKAYGQFSKEFGSKAPEEFRKFVTELSKAPTSAAAASLAIEKLGVRNGPDFAAAVKEGRFAYSDLVDQITNGSDTIQSAGEDTQDFSEKWQMFSNRMKVLVEPIAQEVFGAVGKALDGITPYAEEAAKWLGEQIPKAIAWLRDKWEEFKPLFIDGANQLKDRAKEMGDAVKTALEWLTKPENDAALKAIAFTIGTLVAGAFVALGAAAWDAAAGVVAATWPFLLIAAVVGGVAYAFFQAYEHCETFRRIVDQVRDILVRLYNEALVPAWQFLTEKFLVVWDWLKQKFTELQPKIDELRAGLQLLYEDGLKPVLTFIADNQEMIKNLAIVLGILAGILLVVSLIITGVMIVSLLALVTILGIVALAIGVVIIVIMRIINVLWDWFNNARDAIGGVIERIETVIQFFWDLAQNVGSAIAMAIGAVWGFLGGVQNMANSVNNKIGEIIRWFLALPGQILGAIGNLGGLLWNAGQAVVSGLMDGIRARFEDLKRLLGSVTSFIAEHKGPRSVDLVLLQPAGEAIMQGLMAGISSEVPALQRQLGQITAGIGATPVLSAGAMAMANSGGRAPVEVTTKIEFPGDTDGAFSTAFMRLVRTGQIQITTTAA